MHFPLINSVTIPHLVCMRIEGKLDHRGLKLDGAIGQGEICNSLKSKIFSKSFLSHIEKKKK